jgi:hypothetical protein
MSRTVGILSSLLGLASIVAYFLKFEYVGEWMLMIIITYCMAAVFSSNSFLQDIKVGNPWQRINAICSIFFFICVIFLIVYGFISGQLSTWF